MTLRKESNSQCMKKFYESPLCSFYAVEAEPMLGKFSVQGSVDNDDVSQDPNNPWYTDNNGG